MLTAGNVFSKSRGFGSLANQKWCTKKANSSYAWTSSVKSFYPRKPGAQPPSSYRRDITATCIHDDLSVLTSVITPKDLNIVGPIIFRVLCLKIWSAAQDRIFLPTTYSNSKEQLYYGGRTPSSLDLKQWVDTQDIYSIFLHCWKWISFLKETEMTCCRLD